MYLSVIDHVSQRLPGAVLHLNVQYLLLSLAASQQVTNHDTNYPYNKISSHHIPLQ